MSLTNKIPSLVNHGDLQLTAQLVLKHLQDDRSLTNTPFITDFEVVEVEGGRSNADRLQLNVALDNGLKVCVYQVWPESPFRNLAELSELSLQISKKVAATINEANEIGEMIMEVKDALDYEMTRMGNKGISCRLLSLSLMPIDASTHDLTVVDARVDVEYLPSGHFQMTIKAEDADDVTAAFADLEARKIK